jgi:hypothetical protein
MVLASRRTWIDPQYLHRILEEDRFRKLTRPEDADVGDIVIYHDQKGLPCHVAVVINKRIVQGDQEDWLTVQSQWGADGEYIHVASMVPGYLAALSAKCYEVV